MKRVMVNFTEEQWEIIEKLRGKIGKSDSELVKNIVIAWLSEKSFIKESAEEKD